MATEEEFAPAKLNLTIHVTGRRVDGYHLIDSLVVFLPGVGDTVAARTAAGLSLEITGPMAADLSAPDDNLVCRAARWLAPERGAAITLTKRLPVAAGLGGGSADAAAALRALARLWERPLPAPAACLALGADVPACLVGRPQRMTGAGERLSPVPALPSLPLLLVNPGVAIATGDVFGALDSPHGAPMEKLPATIEPSTFCSWLKRQRNDLEAPALRIAPVIGDVLAALQHGRGCLLARMSGSGATCFGLYASTDARDSAARALKRAHPEWWLAADTA